MGVPEGERLAVEGEHRVVAARLRLGGQLAPRRRLRQPRLPGGEPERRLGAGPRERHAAPVAAADGVPGALPDRVLDRVVGEVLDLPQAQLLAEVQVRRARQREHQQQHRAGAARPQLEVGGRERVRRRQRHAGVLAAVARDVPGLVVVGERPGGGRADAGDGGQRRVDRGVQLRGVERALEEVQVEGGVQLVRAHVAGEPLRPVDHDLPDVHAVAVVAVGDGAPRAVDVVHALDVPQRRPAPRDRLEEVLDEVEVRAAPAPWPGPARRRCAGRRARSPARSAGCPRSPRGRARRPS